MKIRVQGALGLVVSVEALGPELEEICLVRAYGREVGGLLFAVGGVVLSGEKMNFEHSSVPLLNTGLGMFL